MQALNQKKASKLEQKIAQLANNQVVLGVGVAGVASYIPFAASFMLARYAHLTGAYYGSSSSLIAQFGFIAALLSAIAIYDARGSVRSVAVLTGSVFAMMGVVISMMT